LPALKLKGGASGSAGSVAVAVGLGVGDLVGDGVGVGLGVGDADGGEVDDAVSTNPAACIAPPLDPMRSDPVAGTAAAQAPTARRLVKTIAKTRRIPGD